MNRTSLNDGEIFEPSTVDMKIDIKSNSKASIPAIYDCENREIIWCDMNIKETSIKPINIDNNTSSIAKTIDAIVNIDKPTLYDLIAFNAIARGNIVDRLADADIAFLVNDDKVTCLNDNKEITVITPYDINYFISNMM